MSLIAALKYFNAMYVVNFIITLHGRFILGNPQSNLKKIAHVKVQLYAVTLKATCMETRSLHVE